MRKTIITVLSMILLTLITGGSVTAEPGDVPRPAEYFGFKPGDEGKLFDYEQMVEYLFLLDNASEKLAVREIGVSPMGRKMYIVFISSPENIAGLEDLRRINEKLATDPHIGSDERDVLIDRGRVFFLATLSMHSGEVGPSQALPLIAHELITTDDPEILEWLDDVVYMATPCHNPDGMDMVVEHYRKYHGTKYEGASMPGLYHRYVGHDNNRDFLVLTQEDTKAISAVYSTVWYPQVMVEKHQMGSTGVRYFVPPSHDPIAENIDAGIWNWIGIFGMNMIKDMTRSGQSGVAQHYLFDDYWPGSTGTCNWKNVISFLTEGASANYATPIYVEPNELDVHGKGLSEYKKSVNMPLPWPGGWWKLSDIVGYEISSTKSIIKTCSKNKRDILAFRNDLCRSEVERGVSEPPYYYVMPLAQKDRSELSRMVDLLIEHGVEVSKLTVGLKAGGKELSAGDIVVSLAQPYRAFVKEVLEIQRFPLRHYTPGGEPIRPYDITSWSLPLHAGVVSYEIRERSDELERALVSVSAGDMYRKDLPDRFGAAVLAAGDNESFKAAFAALNRKLAVYRLTAPAEIEGTHFDAGSFIVSGGDGGGDPLSAIVGDMAVTPILVQGQPAKMLPEGMVEKVDLPRIALVETWFHDMDAGWTRFIFDSYDIPFTTLRPGDFAGSDLGKKYDVIVFPNNDKDLLMSGKRKRDGEYYPSSYPPEYTKGLGTDGMEKLMAFLDGGGLIVAWGRSAELFSGPLELKRGKDDKEEFDLPFSDLSDDLKKEGFYCPGAMLRIEIATGNPLTWGLPEKAGALFSRGTAFRTAVPRFDMDRRVLAKFPEKDILLSGYAEKEEAIGGTSAFIWIRKGKGQMVLFGFNPQFRASTPGTYKLLFNSLLLADETVSPAH